MGQNRNLRKIKKILLQVKSHSENMRALTDEQLSGLTEEFKHRLDEGETLDQILPEAYAAMCEADYRILGKFPYDVQIMGAIALHQGYLAEMNTGEGKTLSATLPLYLNALTGRGCFLLTTNEYLASRDAEEMGPAYEFMGLSVSSGASNDTGKRTPNEKKKAIYAADIVYTTHSVLGFDYLFNNLVKSADERFMRDFYYVIIDEADSVLLDSAQTPLVISGAPRVQSNLYQMCDFFVSTLVEDVDFEREEETVWLTETGIKNAESYFGIDNFYGREHFEINRHVFLALRAHMSYEAEKDYKVSDEGEVVLLDAASGRMMKGVKMRGGQHQALEAKEKVKLTNENRSMASITYQNLFLLFEKMAGMSGTLSNAKDEFLDVYHEKVIVIPPNFPVQRIDYPDKVYANSKEQFLSAIAMTLQLHSTGQPVLIVASSISDTEILSQLLVREGIAHNVLNANNAYWEAQIIKEAGQRNAVTVATSMAGRGTDIKLGEGVKELGGLAVIGVGRMKSTREERQARGRAGRQGDPGCSYFFICLEDDVVIDNGADLEKYVEGKRRMNKWRMKRIINSAQAIGQEMGVSGRKQSVQYDQVMQAQRKLIYETRNHLLDGGDVSVQQIFDIAKENIHVFLSENKKLTMPELNRYILDNISYTLDNRIKEIDLEDRVEVENYLITRVGEELMRQSKKLGGEKKLANFMRVASLEAVDEGWVEQVDYLQQLSSAVSGRSSAQRNVIFEFQNEAAFSFQNMERMVKRNIMRNILLSDASYDSEDNLRMILP